MLGHLEEAKIEMKLAQYASATPDQWFAIGELRNAIIKLQVEIHNESK